MYQGCTTVAFPCIPSVCLRFAMPTSCFCLSVVRLRIIFRIYPLLYLPAYLVITHWQEFVFVYLLLTDLPLFVLTCLCTCLPTYLLLMGMNFGFVCLLLTYLPPFVFSCLSSYMSTSWVLVGTRKIRFPLTHSCLDILFRA